MCGARVPNPTALAEQASESSALQWIGRVGLAARGLVYCLMGLLAVLITQGVQAQVDQRGALQQVLDEPFGWTVVAVMAIGFACYAVWRLSQAAFGVAGEDVGAGPRVKALGGGLAYGALTVTSLALLMGSSSSSDAQNKSMTAKTLDYTGGRWLVGAIGVAIIVGAVVVVVQGFRLSFMTYFPEGAMTAQTRAVIRQLGRIGAVARGTVFALVGWFIVSAAWTHDSEKARGLDGALKSLRDQPYGQFLIIVSGLGLLTFGIYGFAEARYRRV